MHIIQMAQEQHAIFLGMPFLGVLGKFDRNRKWIYIHQVNNQTNLKSVATMMLCFYLLHVSVPLAVPQLPLHHQL